MVYKKLIALITSFLLLVSYVLPCSAEQGSAEPVVVSDETRTVSFDVGTVQYAGTVVAVSVWKPGYSSKDMEDVFAKKIKLYDINAYSGEVIVDADKRIKETFVLDSNAPSGQYALEIHIPGNDAPDTYMFNFRNVARAAAILEIAKTSDAEAIQDALELGVLDINVESGLLYLTYSDEVKQYISTNIAETPPLDDNSFKDLITYEVNKIETVKKMVSAEESRETVKNIIEENYELFLLNSPQDDCWTKYNNLTDVQKEKLYIRFTSKLSNCVFPEDVKEIFKLGLKAATEENTITPPSGGSGGLGGSGGSGGAVSKPSEHDYISVSNDITTSKEPLPEYSKYNFDDISNHWAKGVIEYLTTRGVLKGKSETKFAPDDYITREEFVKIIVSALDLKSSSVEAMAFNDVVEKTWYYDYIATAQALDIVSGIASDKFGVGLNITRQDLATILHKAVARTGKVFGEEEHIFADVEEVDTYAKIAVTKLGGVGVISGYEDNTFKPNNPATRAEAVQMIYNVMNILKLF